MNGQSDNSDVLVHVDPEESVAAAEASVAAALENPPEVPQPTECVATEDTSQEPEQPDPPPAAELSGTQPRWEVGAPCRAVWSEDGSVYPARVVALDGERCRVRFTSYDNEEDLDLSALMSPEPETPKSAQPSSALSQGRGGASPHSCGSEGEPCPLCQDWKAGSRCRAVYANDGRVYPAVVLWVRGQRCRIRFDNYNNEEECDVGALLSSNELHGGSRAPAPKSGSLRSGGGGGGYDWKRRRREEFQGERGGERRQTVRDRASSQDGAEKEQDERRRDGQRSDAAPGPAFSFAPPFRPPLDPCPGDPPSFIAPPPPPLWMSGGREASGGGVGRGGGGRLGSDAMSSLLMQWYMCGFFTGSFMTQQKFTTS